MKGKTVGEAARDAGYSDKNPDQSGYQALKIAKKKVPELMDIYGLSPAALIEKYLAPALEATETKFFQKDGKITDEADVVAWGPRIQALDIAFNLGGSYPQTGKNGNGVAVNVQIVTNTQFADPYAP